MSSQLCECSCHVKLFLDVYRNSSVKVALSAVKERTETCQVHGELGPFRSLALVELVPWLGTFEMWDVIVGCCGVT